MFHGLCNMVERSGVSRQRLMEAAQLRFEDLAASDARLSRASFERTCAGAIALTGDAGLGMRWAALLTDRGFGPISRALGHASSLRAAFELLARFETFFANEPSCALIEAAAEARVRIPTAGDRPLSVRRFLDELSLAWYANLVRTMRGGAALDWVAFTHEAPPYRDAYTQVFGARVRFAQPFAEISFPRAWLDAPRGSTADGSDARGADRAAELHQLLVQRAPQRMNMPDAADALGLGERALRRRLTAEGHSFKEIEYRALAEVATQMLLDEHRSIEDTALAMGFSGAGAFQRAFRRWTGRAPRSVQRTAARR